MPPAPSVEGWEGEGVYEVALQVDFEPALVGLDMEFEIRSALATIGVDVAGDADAALTFDLDGTPYSYKYGSFGYCYTAAQISGRVTLSAPDLPDVSDNVSYRLQRPSVVFSSQCRAEPDGAPYVETFMPTLTEALASIWGPSAVPYLISVLDGEVRNSGHDYPHWAAALDGFRRLNDGDISEGDTREFIARAIDVVEELVESGNSGHGVDVAVRKLLEAYAGTNYGVATADDVQQWRDWLDGWDGP